MPANRQFAVIFLVQKPCKRGVSTTAHKANSLVLVPPAANPSTSHFLLNIKAHCIGDNFSKVAQSGRCPSLPGGGLVWWGCNHLLHSTWATMPHQLNPHALPFTPSQKASAPPASPEYCLLDLPPEVGWWCLMEPRHPRISVSLSHAAAAFHPSIPGCTGGAVILIQRPGCVFLWPDLQADAGPAARLYWREAGPVGLSLPIPAASTGLGVPAQGPIQPGEVCAR